MIPPWKIRKLKLRKVYKSAQVQRSKKVQDQDSNPVRNYTNQAHTNTPPGCSEKSWHWTCILGNSLLYFPWKTPWCLRDIHMKYTLHWLVGSGVEQSTFLSLAHSAPFYTRKYRWSWHMCDRGQGRGQDEKGKKYVEMNLVHVQRPKMESPVEMNRESRANRAVCLVPSAHRVASEDNYHRLIGSINLLGTLTSWAASGLLPVGETKRALWLLRKDNQLGKLVCWEIQRLPHLGI